MRVKTGDLCSHEDMLAHRVFIGQAVKIGGLEMVESYTASVGTKGKKSGSSSIFNWESFGQPVALWQTIKKTRGSAKRTLSGEHAVEHAGFISFKHRRLCCAKLMDDKEY